MKIRDFVHRFFDFYGAEIRAEERALYIQLNPQNPSYESLRSALGQESFHLVFDLQAFLPNTELMMIGHPLLDRMDEFLKRQGSKTAVFLPKRYRATKKEARHYVSPLFSAFPKKRKIKLTQEEQWQDRLFFHFKIHYVSAIHHQEEILTEGIALDSGSPVALQQMTLLAEGQELLRWKPPENFPLVYEQALAKITEKVRVRAVHLEKQLWEELKHSGTRLEEYYRHQIQDIPNKDFLVQDRRVAQLQKELKNQLQLLVERYQLKVSMQLLGYAVLRVPYQQFRFQFTQGAKSFFYDRFHGTWDVFCCEQCQALPTRELSLVCVENGKIFCSRCVRICPKCQELSGALKPCGICGALFCEHCVHPCFQCHLSLCASDQQICFFCGYKICQNCASRCMLCVSSGCREHFFEFETQSYCEQCLFECKRCHRKAPKSHKKNCSVCGQQFCFFCFQKCPNCSNEYCTIHSHCNQCGEKT